MIHFNPNSSTARHCAVLALHQLNISNYQQINQVIDLMLNIVLSSKINDENYSMHFIFFLIYF